MRLRAKVMQIHKGPPMKFFGTVRGKFLRKNVIPA